MLAFGGGPGVRLALPVTLTTLIFPPVTLRQFFVPRTWAQTYSGNVLPTPHSPGFEGWEGYAVFAQVVLHISRGGNGRELHSWA